MNKEVMFSSKTDLWGTPQDLFDELDAEFHFDLDVCALPENAKCKRYYTPEQDGLVQEWAGTCWCNPPYGRQIGKWVKKAYECGTTVVMLVPARTDTKWFHDYIYGKAEVRFLRGRLHFVSAGGCPTLNASHENPILIGEKRMNSVVRRLTPLECERLQGMPDNWSKYGIDENGKEYALSDSARYRIQGNGVALPFWAWLLKRISAQYERPATLGSLFDGQGSFPLAWMRLGNKAVWSSEIEKHAVAVARKHFGDEEAGIEGDIRSYL